ncbi:class I SAM-dependent methyltransferase [Streptomyces sp. NBC_01314]|uniref:class I SAM-dependent methyltransferase n=1 Tax=Streptomyces sp. NBC_01314 TaxID=2903821 RepID=UPI00308F2F68|nr:class I SAM-dependent methyltransferase [Streptomyces sp. NBC_01314]WRZ54327.1 class I SAM-dependent methyltransferase [Streptomyces sp. NBC_01314]
MPPTAESPPGYAAYRRRVAGSFGHWYRRRRDSWTGAHTSEAITRFALEHAPHVTGRRPKILDVGCGRGRQTTDLTERLDAEGTGLDLLDVWDTPPPARGRVRFRQGDFLQFTGAGQDLVVDNGCLHHQRRADWQAWAAHGAGLLRPGGVLVVSVFLSPDGTLTELPLDDGRLNWWLTEEIVTGLYGGAGLTPTGRLVIDRDFPYRGHRLAYLALAFRKDPRTTPLTEGKGNPA